MNIKDIIDMIEDNTSFIDAVDEYMINSVWMDNIEVSLDFNNVKLDIVIHNPDKYSIRFNYNGEYCVVDVSDTDEDGDIDKLEQYFKTV